MRYVVYGHFFLTDIWKASRNERRQKQKNKHNERSTEQPNNQKLLISVRLFEANQVRKYYFFIATILRQ